ncbi:ribonuclease H [Xylariaceae sp. FL0255]|nr:ribonuclease H [Xylariaceae sp. FL0255]
MPLRAFGLPVSYHIAASVNKAPCLVLLPLRPAYNRHVLRVNASISNHVPTAIIMPATKSATKAQAEKLPASEPATTSTETTDETTQGSKKRKMDKPKYYAVRCGHKPGVYDTYEECYKQIEGFKGSSHKGFQTLEDAEAFVLGKKTSVDKKPAEDKFYAIAVGANPGIYTDWSEAQKSGNLRKHKKFSSRADAIDFMRAHGNADAQQWLLDNEGLEPPKKKAKKTSTKKNEKKEYPDDDPDVEAVYTDGACSNNGRNNPVAGIGVYWGEGDERNVSERLEGDIQTNNRAELTAILRAIEGVEKSQAIRIYTDSKLSIDSITIWYKKWQEHGETWKTSTGQDVVNQDVMKIIRAKMVEREELGTKTLFQYVKGHADDPGNIAADKLAVEGSKKQKTQ